MTLFGHATSHLSVSMSTSDLVIVVGSGHRCFRAIFVKACFPGMFIAAGPDLHVQTVIPILQLLRSCVRPFLRAVVTVDALCGGGGRQCCKAPSSGQQPSVRHLSVSLAVFGSSQQSRRVYKPSSKSAPESRREFVRLVASASGPMPPRENSFVRRRRRASLCRGTWRAARRRPPNGG